MISKIVILSIFFFINFYVHQIHCEVFDSEEDLQTWLNTEYEVVASELCNRQSLASWDYNTDTGNSDKQQALEEVTVDVAEIRRQYFEDYFSFLDLNDIVSDELRRQLKPLMNLGTAALETDKLTQLTNIQTTMSGTYSRAMICPYANQDCTLEVDGMGLEPDIEEVMATSTDYNELKYTWKAWRDASGANIRSYYGDYVALSNEAARANGYEDMGDMWRDRYETENFIDSLDHLWEQVEPLYDALHTYVRRKLQTLYSDDVDMSDGLIPANVLGNMWAQSWVNIGQHVKPFPAASEVDVTSAMVAQDYTPERMFVESNKFYMSMGLEDNSMSYGSKAMIEKPTDGRQVLCHASAWDFCDGEDFRVKMCTNVDMEDFITVHHEMGHIQYYLQYKNQPYSFRGGANPGFHEAVGDTIALSVATPEHLQKIELLTGYEDNDETAINALMEMALERVAFLPFGYLIDKWRWDVFSGEVDEGQWNTHWWNYRETLQKVKAPVRRTEEDFDPGAKYHVAGNSQYINYFVAHILEFQMYKGLCIAAGEYDPDNEDSKPLHKCDFYESLDAGDRLKAGLSLGSSVPWSKALQAMTGETDLDATALLEYFEPLYEYLLVENSKNMPENELEEFLSGEYAAEAQTVYGAQVHAEWEYAVDVDNSDKAIAQTVATLNTAAFEKTHWTDLFQYLDVNNYEDSFLQRQVQILKVLGDSALEEGKLSQLTTAISDMTNIYSTAKICPYNSEGCNLDSVGLTLDPDIEEIMSTSTDYDVLLYAWTAWRDVSGAQMKEQFKTYVDLSNEAAEANGFANKGEMWRSDFESETFIEDLDNLWVAVEPLYNELHTFVLNKLKTRYAGQIDEDEELIPAHILGNMWAQNWNNLAELVRPYPDETAVNVTAALVEKGYDVLAMFDKANEFYTSLGLEDNSMSYDVSKGAMIEKPEDREVLCHASAWDFLDGETFRVKMCTKVDYNDFITIHHELGHIQYYLLYKDLPITLRAGANPGFHEAVGDTIALSVATPQHLATIGLLDDYEDTDEASINALMDMALERVAFLPFGLLIDKWRWDIFAGDVPEEQWNDHWWNYRETIQKVKAPVARPSDAFDPGAKFHVAADYQYISYFVAHILEFQLYKALCIEAGEYDPVTKDRPLHKCDYYNSVEAGNLLRVGLSLGSSVHWSQALHVMTGETNLDATALLEYFEPLYEYLREQNTNPDPNPDPEPNPSEDELVEFLREEYAVEAEAIYGAQVHAEWEYATDVNDEDKAAAQTQAILNTAAFEKTHWTDLFQYLDVNNYEDSVLQRQVRILKVLGDSALEDEKLSQLSTAINDMTNIYSSAKICPYNTEGCDLDSVGLALDPGIEEIMSTSTNYDVLLYAWTAWRDVSGAQMKEQFKTYVDLSNEAAEANGFANKGEMWRSDFESETFIADVDNLWAKVEPLYKELHTFVLNKLKTRYEDQIDEEEELIPAHILGNMWAQNWNNLAELVRPYPDETTVDVTAALVEKGYDVLAMFEKANEFYTSLGLEDNSVSYDVSKGAMIEKPEGRDVLCHASAWDFLDGETFRVKMCTKVDYNDFITIHHELGHIQYFLLYKGLPITLRTGANPGFHEAVGDTIALSVATPQHLKTIGLLDDYEDTEEASINALMDMALERVAFLPFGLLIDKWRWDVFAGDVPEEEWNDHWWHYRETLQKVKAPVARPSDAFDPGAKYHVAGDSQYISYFIAHILEFQFYKALCIEAGQYDPATKDPPLHKCDYFNSKAAGDLLREGLQLGASKHWSEVLEIITGETEISASALLEYFDPLYEYLKKANSAVVFKISHLTYISSFLVAYFLPRFFR